jgi:hypothetical protein
MTNRRIGVPARLGDKDLINFFRTWAWENDPADEVVLDFSKCQFIAPWALVLFTTYAIRLGDDLGVDVTMRIDGRTRAGSFIIQAGLFELLGHERPEGSLSTVESRTTRLTQIRTSKDIPPFATSATALLAIDDPDLEGAVRYSIVELLRNVVQHSRSPVGEVAMAQFFPKTGIVELAVADPGIGVLAALQPRYGDLADDLAGLKFAMLPHVSGTFGQGAYGTMLNNAGLGLFFIKEIITRSAAGFFLGSGRSLADLWGNSDGSPGKKYAYSGLGGWPGTFAVLQFRRGRIEDFDALLAVCRELAARARADNSEIDIDFIDEAPEHPNVVRIEVAAFEEDVDVAASVRDEEVIAGINNGKIIVLDFAGIRFATQSFVHALMYKVFRDVPRSRSMLCIANASNASKEAIRAVAAYARTSDKHSLS